MISAGVFDLSGGSLDLNGSLVVTALDQGARRRELSAEQPALQRPLCPRLAEISGDLAHFTRLAPFVRCNSSPMQM
jgi:hypothetical protein